MTQHKFPSTLFASLLAGALLVAVPVQQVVASPYGEGSDQAFNEMLADMSGRDTGSMWIDFYVESLNQRIAFIESSEAYGAAGPSGPLTGFDGYLSSFVDPDTGSRWFNAYVDSVKQTLRAQEERQ